MLPDVLYEQIQQFWGVFAPLESEKLRNSISYLKVVGAQSASNNPCM